LQGFDECGRRKRVEHSRHLIRKSRATFAHLPQDYKIAGTLDSHTRYAGARREPFVESTLDEARAGCSFEPYKQWLSVFSKKHPYARVVCFDSVRVHPFEVRRRFRTSPPSPSPL
jgi:hypothetical protein